MGSNLAERLAKMGVKVIQASPITPEDTGRLKYTSIHATDAREDGDKYYAKIVFDLKIVPYTYWLEYNTFVGATTHRNIHKGFIEKLAERELVPWIEREIFNV